MHKKLPILIGILLVTFFVSSFAPRVFAADPPSNTTCQDKKTVRISGKVWESIIYGNFNASIGVPGVSVLVTRGDGKAVKILTGKGYIVDPTTGAVKSTVTLTTPGEAPGPRYGIFDLCGFIHDAEYYAVDYRGNVIPSLDYRPKNNVPNPLTTYTIRIDNVPAGYVYRSYTTFTPTFTGTRGTAIPDTRGFGATADTRFGAAVYQNQIAGSLGNGVLGIKGCNDNSVTTPGQSPVKYRCDFHILKGEVKITPSPTIPLVSSWPVGGTVKSISGTPLNGIRVIVWNGTLGTSRVVTTGAVGFGPGEFRVDRFVYKGHAYAVRVDAGTVIALGYTATPGTVTDKESYNTSRRGNTPYGSSSYEYQMAANHDCSSNLALRCNFMFSPVPTRVPTKVPPTPTRVPTKVPPTPTKPLPSRTPTPIACEARTLDLVLILDKSSSIKDNIQKERDAAKKLVGGLSQSAGGVSGQIRVGVVMYYSKSLILSGMVKIVPGSTELENVYNAIDKVKYVEGENGSCLRCAEANAATLLAGSKATNKRVIMMTDGRANASGEENKEYAYPAVNAPMRDAVKLGQDAKKAGIIYYAIGYGSTSRTRGDVISAITGDSAGIVPNPPNTGTVTDESLLKKSCAYPPTKFSNSLSCNYIYDNNANNWVNTFAALAGKICPSLKNKVLNYTAAVENDEPKNVLSSVVGAVTDFFKDKVYYRVYARD